MLDRLKRWAKKPATKDDVWRSTEFLVLSLLIVILAFG